MKDTAPPRVEPVLGSERTLRRSALAMRVRSPGTRTKLSVALPLAALAAAVAAALVPAEPERATFSWPPSHVPSGQPGRSWLAPLMLNRRTAASIHVRLPCRAGPMLPGAGSPAIVLATARDVRGRRALEISRPRGQNELRVRVGPAELGRFVAPSTGPCALDVRISGRRWTVRQSPRGADVAGKLASRVGVDGLITQLDLSAGAKLRVQVTPSAQDTTPSAAQTALRLLAVALLAAVLLLAIGDLRGLRRRLAHARPLRSPSLPDALVVVTLVTWWIVGPAYYDDGWVTARQTNYLRSGGFSNYFDNYAANLPFGTWFEWLQHLVVAHTGALIIQRIPSLVCLAALWLVCRAILSRLVGSPPSLGNVTWWSAALAFCVGAAAFDVTLRPEPMNALLVGGVLLCAVRFAARPAVAPLAAAVLLAGLAVTEHPEGIVALAPLLVCLPRIVREARKRTSITPGALLAVLVSGLAWTGLLAFLDSDLRHRLADAGLFREGEPHSGGVLEEWLRYQSLSYSSSLRRELLALCVLCVLSLLAWGRRGRRLEERLPSASVGLALPLLAFVPSKWPWNFGVFVGLCAVAVGAEVARLLEYATSTRRRSFLPLVFAFLVVSLLTGWAAATPARWGPLDLRTISHLYFAAGGVLFGLWAIFVAAAVAAAAALRRRPAAVRLSSQAARLSLPVILALVLALTTLVFVVDALATPGWTYARQIVDVVTSRSTCGLADELVVPDSRSMAAVARIRPAHARLVARGAPAAPVQGVDVLTVGSSRGPSTVLSPWYRVAGNGRAFGLYVGGTWRRSESLTVIWGRVTRRRVVAISGGRANLAKAAKRGPEPAAWRFIAQSSLPSRPAHAAALRLRIVGAMRRASAPRTFVSGPISYLRMGLAAHMRGPSAVTLVSPALLEAMPCARLPTVELGLGQPPTLLVDWNLPPFLTDSKGPFGAIPDLFKLRRLPLADSEDPPREVAVYEVAVDRRDGVLPATRADT